jgi:hypothetical protein
VSLHVQLLAVAGAAGLLLAVLELVRRRRFLERYALVWMASAVALLALAAWRPGLEIVARLLGIAYAPSALFLVAGAFVILLLLHFSIAVSRLTDQSKVLAQRLALLEERQRQAEAPSAPVHAYRSAEREDAEVGRGPRR